MHWNGMVSDPAVAAELKEAGFRSTSRYNVNSAKKVRPDGTESYDDVMTAHRQHWERMLAAPLVNVPVVSRGWDATPAKFEQLLRDASQFIRRDPRQPFAVLVYAWNEWTEGAYLLPEAKDGQAHLEAIRRVFGTALPATCGPSSIPPARGRRCSGWPST